MTVGPVNIITTVYEAIITIMFANTYANKSENKPFYIYILLTLGLAGTITLSNRLFYLGYLNILILTALNFTIFFLFSNQLKRSIMLAVILTAVFSITEVSVLFLLTGLLHASVAEITTVETYRIMGTVLSKLLAFIVVKIICVKHASNKEIAIKTSYWFLFFLIFFICTLTVYLLYILQYYSAAPTMYNQLATGCAIGLLYTLFFSLALYEKTIKQAEEEKNQEVFRQQFHAQKKHMDEIAAAQTEIKKLRHDMKNHHIAIKGYLDHQNYKGATQYLEKIQGAMDKTDVLFDTGNMAFDAIINTKRDLAERNSIAFSAFLQIPENLFLDPVDACILFGNALDNAIEACLRMKNGKKQIDISLTYAENALLCKISNTAEIQNKAFLHTEKPDENTHGFGIENIKAVLKKYDSVYVFEQSEKEFSFYFKIVNQKC